MSSLESNQSPEKNPLEELLENITNESELIDAKEKIKNADKNFLKNPAFLKKYNKIADELASRELPTSLYNLFFVFKLRFSPIEGSMVDVESEIANESIRIFEDSIKFMIDNPQSASGAKEVINSAQSIKILGGNMENLEILTRNILQESYASEAVFEKVLKILRDSQASETETI